MMIGSLFIMRLSFGQGFLVSGWRWILHLLNDGHSRNLKLSFFALGLKISSSLYGFSESSFEWDAPQLSFRIPKKMKILSRDQVSELFPQPFDAFVDFLNSSSLNNATNTYFLKIFNIIPSLPQCLIFFPKHFSCNLRNGRLQRYNWF